MARRRGARSPSASPPRSRAAARASTAAPASGGGDPQHAIVVGAGIGGLAVAGRLRKAGLRVTLLEKNDHPGGRCDQVAWKGHRFDSGPSFILLPDAFQDTFAALGERMDDHIELTRVDPTYSVRFSDGEHPLELTADLGKMQAQMEAIEPGSFQRFLAYVAEGRQGLHLLLRHIAHREWRSAWNYFSLRQLPLLWNMHALDIHYRRVSNFFTSPKLRAAFTFQDMYIGLSPYEAPATFSLLQATEFCDGVWYSKGGLYAIIAALKTIVLRSGVDLRCNTAVESIELGRQTPNDDDDDDDDDAAAADKPSVVLEDGTRLSADLVVATADLPYVYDKLLPPATVMASLGSWFSRNPASLQLSSSTISFFWALRREYTQLGHHNMFLADGAYRQSFEQIFEDNTLPDLPSFYINAPSRSDPTMAPAGACTINRPLINMHD